MLFIHNLYPLLDFLTGYYGMVHTMRFLRKPGTAIYLDVSYERYCSEKFKDPFIESIRTS